MWKFKELWNTQDQNSVAQAQATSAGFDALESA